jgi:hypothetical protein
MPEDPLKEQREQVASVMDQIRSEHPELSGILTRQEMAQSGLNFWHLSYKHTQDDMGAFESLYDSLLKDKRRAALAAVFAYLPMEQTTFFWTARWADQGFPVIQPGHKYAAALMATHVSAEYAEDIHPPFKAFLLEVPNGLISIEDPKTKKLQDIKSILVHHLVNSKGENVWNYVAMTDSRLSIWKHGASGSYLCDPNDDETEHTRWSGYSFALETDERDERAHRMIARFILNVCLAMSEEGHVKKIGKGHSAEFNLRESKEPVCRVFQVGQPIVLDCRQAIRDYMDGRLKKSASPSVQVLVRGHWKRQPYGPKASLRKWIWREPFWRGPEDAPILTRPLKLRDE